MQLSPFFKYAGGKWNRALLYPEPEHGTIIEPFCGSAGYSTRFHQRNVVLVDADSRITDLWEWLIRADQAEIMAIPILEVGDRIEDMGLSSGQARLVSYSVNCAAGPRYQCTDWQTWDERRREMVASQVEHIRHWRVFCGDYSQLVVGGAATYFVDPPYKGKQFYRETVSTYAELGVWCQSRHGQVIVCEGAGAKWLPFTKLYVSHGHQNGGASKVKEFVWSKSDRGAKTPARVHWLAARQGELF